MEGIDVRDFVFDCALIDDPGKLATRAMQEARKSGFEFISASGGALSYPRPEQVLYAGFPEEWTELYLANALYERDPVLKRCVGAEMPFEWSDLLQDAEPEEAEVLEQAGQVGLRCGYVVPLQGLGSYTGYVSFGGEEVELSPQARLDLHVIGIYFHNRVRELRDQKPEEPSYWGADLSEREKECLKWFAAGKSNWEVGEILRISENTVKRHADRIKEKLGVSTRVQVVVEGIRRGLVWF